MRILLLACACIAALAGSAQAATAANAPVSATKSINRKSPPHGLTDATIEQAIRAKLNRSKIGADRFTVKVQGGVAYWEGKTNVIQHKGAATRMAKSAGAAAVVNNIQVSDAARQKAAHNLKGTIARAQVVH